MSDWLLDTLPFSWLSDSQHECVWHHLLPCLFLEFADSRFSYAEPTNTKQQEHHMWSCVRDLQLASHSVTIDGFLKLPQLRRLSYSVADTITLIATKVKVQGRQDSILAFESSLDFIQSTEMIDVQLFMGMISYSCWVDESVASIHCCVTA